MSPTEPTLEPAPAGFRPAPIGGAFIQHNGPLWARLVDDRLQLAFQVAPHQVNPLNICHGGMLATFADMLVPMAALYQGHEGERRFLPTISLQLDYLASAPLGAWVIGEADILRRTRNLVFGQGVARVNGEAILRVSGIFKQGLPFGDPGDNDPLRLRV